MMKIQGQYVGLVFCSISTSSPCSQMLIRMSSVCSQMLIFYAKQIPESFTALKAQG